MMAEKPTYEELKKRVKVLEEEASEGQLAKKAILRTEERYRTLFDESLAQGLFPTFFHLGDVIFDLIH